MTLDDTNIIDSLVKLGLNPREAKLYFALLRTPEATPAELDRLSSVPRTKVYEVLGQMATKGLCSERREGNKKFYRATRPSELALQLQTSWELGHKAWEKKFHQRFEAERAKWVKKRDRLTAEQEKQASLHQDRRDLAEDVFGGLDGVYLSSLELNPSLENAKIIRSTDQIKMKLMEAYSNCKEEMLGFNRSPYLAADPEILAQQHNIFSEMLERGVKMRDIYMDETAEHHWMRDSIQILTAKGGASRFVRDLPMKMFVIDRKIAMIALPSVPGITRSDFTMLILDDPGFLKACITLFETFWAGAATLEEWLAW